MNELKEKTKQNNGKKIKSGLKLFLVMMIAAGLIGVGIGLLDFFKINPVRRSVSLSLEFTYDGATKHQLPNGDMFTIEGIRTDQVIGVALKSLELEDKYTVDGIRRALSVTGAYPEDVIDRISDYDSVYDYEAFRDVKQNNYYPTVYNIKLYDSFDPGMSRLEMSDILKAIVESYREYFIREYVFAYEFENEDEILSIESADYRQQINLIRGKLEILKSFAKKLYGRHVNFIYNDMSFNDFYIRCTDIEKNGLTSLESIVMMKAYSKDPQRLKDMYNYRIEQLENELDSKRNNLEAVGKIIDAYEMDDILYMNMGDSYVKVDSNSEKTYEQLTAKRIALNDEIANINENIARNREYLEDLKVKADQTALKDIGDQINDFNTRLTGLEQSFAEMVKAYDDFLVTKEDLGSGDIYYTSPSLLSGAFVKRAAKFAIPACMLAFMVFCVLMVKRERRGQPAKV